MESNLLSWITSGASRVLDRIGRWRRLQVSLQLVSQRRFDMCLDNGLEVS